MGIAYGDGIDEEARAFGLFGGKPGSINRIELRYPDGKIHEVKSKEIIRGVPKGTHFYQEAGGGGGYGDPHKRPVEKVWEEVVDGLISVEQAREAYGVVIDPSTIEINPEETEKLRGKS